jgi:hypothetical protein
LHNRLTATIFLKPFTLRECEKYFRALKISVSRRQIAEYYMIMGGVPFYLSHIKKGKSITQNIDNMFFARKVAICYINSLTRLLSSISGL